MKPKTKIQKDVFALSQKLPDMTEKQKNWGYKHCFESIGYRTKKNISCLDCGHQWEDEQPPLLTSIDGCVCPNCDTQLRIESTRKWKNKQSAYYSIITSFRGYQVVRFFDVYAYYKKGEKPVYACCEIVQRWFAPDGNDVTIARKKGMFSMYSDRWDWSSDMEVRPKTNATCYNLMAYKTYPYKSIIPELRRRGFKGDTHRVGVSSLFNMLLNNSKAETLFKAGQYKILEYCVGTLAMSRIERYWPSLRICIRNGYKVEDVSSYFDYLNLLDFFGKDLRNAHYVCPEDFNKAHDTYVEKKNKDNAKMQAYRNRKKAIENEAAYKEFIERYNNIVIKKDNIVIRPLQTVQEFVEESEEMKHCVFASEYFKRENSLILSAKKDGERVETVEFDLEVGKVVQSRGKFNKNTELHDTIVGLVNSNKGKILERSKVV